MKLHNFHTIVNETPDHLKESVKLSMDILDRIHELLDEKFDGKQHLLAKKMNKTEAQISKWLSGVQNYTTKTLMKLSIAFGEPIVAVCTKHDDATFAQVKIPYNTLKCRVIVTMNGNMQEEKQEYKKVTHNKESANIINKDVLL